MGRSSLIMVLGFIVIFGSIRNNIHANYQESVDLVIDYYSEVQAYHIARSAVDYAVSQHILLDSTSGTFSNGDFMNGSYEATITVLGSDSSRGVDTVRIAATGSYSGISHTTIAEVLTRNSLIPVIHSPVQFHSDNTSFNFSGGVSISGNDTNMDGSTGSGEELPGLTVSNTADSIAAADALNSDWQTIQGAGPEPSININEESNNDIAKLVDYYETIADYTVGGTEFSFNKVWGTAENPVIVYGDRKTTFLLNHTGYGVLALREGFINIGIFKWYGLVLIDAPAENALDASIGLTKIYGNVSVSGTNTALVFILSASINYSTEAINMVKSELEERGEVGRSIVEWRWYE